MNYKLSKQEQNTSGKGFFATIGKLLSLMGSERKNLYKALLIILINTFLNLSGPIIIGYAIDNYVLQHQFNGVYVCAALLLGIYLLALFTSYSQTMLMGGVGQRMLFNLRNTLFNKLQELPVDFFYQNKAGDLISRLNNDTDKINQFFSQSLVQFMSGIFTMTGAGIFLLSINFKLGIAALLPALVLFVFSKSISPWVKDKNAKNLKSTGDLSADIQENLNNFKVIAAFGRREYFNEKLSDSARRNYKTSVWSGIANSIFVPVYGFLSNIGVLVVLMFGIYMIFHGQFTIGLLISYLAYVMHFYNPLRQLAALWANFQVALAGWDRIAQILSFESNLPIIPETEFTKTNKIISFENVSFSYPNGTRVLENISFELQSGKTYAFVGPTGGGKTTIASLMSRLYDPISGKILIEGQDIRSMSVPARTSKIGFILQEPFIFTGTVRDNILYGNACYAELTDLELLEVMSQYGLDALLSRFDQGMQTPIKSGSEGISLGQKQLLAFIRALLRKPDILILDEATANIDTVTEQQLETILQKLPQSTTRVIIAHRLNTIESADEIYFVNAGSVLLAGSFDDAVKMLLHYNKQS